MDSFSSLAASVHDPMFWISSIIILFVEKIPGAKLMRFAIITVLYGDSTADFMKFLECNHKYIVEQNLKIFIIDNGKS